MADKLFSKISEANNKYGMFSGNDKILVALSGGADSVSLLLSLKEYFPELTLYACHINHMIRGEYADADCDFCKDLCEKIGVTFDYLKADIPTMSKEQGLSTELTARNVRYAYFKEVCRKYGIKSVALAHTLSDNAETVLFNLARGTALSGLCGIPPKRPLCDGVAIIRPLILASRTEIEEYLSSRNQSFVTDVTNLSDDYTRNYFRHNVVPKFKKINPSFEENLGKMCASLRETDSFIKNSVQNCKTDSVYELSLLDECLRKEIIVKLYRDFTGNTDIENVHICKISEIMCKAAASAERFEICLPGNVSAIIADGKLSFSATLRKATPAPVFYYELFYGLNDIKETGFAVYVASEADIPCVSDNYTLYDKADIYLEDDDVKLYARNREAGDFIKSGGMSKKLKELFNHRKIPTEIRCLLPIICLGEDIIYVPGTKTLNDSVKKGKHHIRIFIYSTTPQ